MPEGKKGQKRKKIIDNHIGGQYEKSHSFYDKVWEC